MTLVLVAVLGCRETDYSLELPPGEIESFASKSNARYEVDLTDVRDLKIGPNADLVVADGATNSLILINPHSGVSRNLLPSRQSIGSRADSALREFDWLPSGEIVLRFTTSNSSYLAVFDPIQKDIKRIPPTEGVAFGPVVHQGAIYFIDETLREISVIESTGMPLRSLSSGSRIHYLRRGRGHNELLAIRGQTIHQELVSIDLSSGEQTAVIGRSNFSVEDINDEKISYLYEVVPNGPASVGPNDLIFVSMISKDGKFIGSVSVDGSFKRIAGIGPPGYTGDGVKATRSNIVAQLIVGSKSGDLYLGSNGKIRRITLEATP